MSQDGQGVLPKVSARLIKRLSRDTQHVISGKLLEYVCNPEENNADALKNDATRIIDLLVKAHEID